MTLFSRTVLLLAASLAPLLSMHVYDLSQVRRAETEAAELEARRRVGEVEGVVRRTIYEAREILIVLSQTDMVLDGDYGTCITTLDRMATQLPQAKNIQVTDAGGTVRCSTKPAAVGVFIGDTPHIQAAARNGTFTTGNIATWRVNDKLVLPLVLPYWRATGEFGGYLTATLAVDWLRDMVAQQPFPNDSVITIADRDGTVFVRHPTDSPQADRLAPHLAALMDEPDPGVVALKVDGSTRIVAYAPPVVGQPDLFFAFEVPAVRHIPATATRTWRSLWIGAAAFLLALLAAAALYRYLLIVPIRALLDTATRWAGGDYRVRADVAPHAAEISQLAHAFNAMAAAIEERARVRDVAERAMADARKEAERANLAKSSFIASASHDLRQPVQSLMLFSSILAQRLADDAQLGPIVGQAERATLALKALLDGMLDISRLDAGAVTPKVVELPVGPLLTRLRDEYALRAESGGLKFRFVGSTCCLSSDPILLERILRNLIDNAIKYTHEGRILVGCRRHDGAVRIEVHDTGIGIPRDKLGAIFDEFAQLDGCERDGKKGLGLGLAITERLARLLGHRIEVRSRVGRGSCFTLTVPLGSSCGGKAEPIAAAHAGGKSMVVVIEDDNDVRAGLQAQIEAWGHQVVAGVDHIDVLRRLERRPDAMLADFRLHGSLTGIDVLGHIAQAMDHDIPCALLTGDTAGARIAEAYRGGYPLLLRKPITAEELADCLGMLLAA